MCCRGLALAVFISGIVSGINAAADQGKFLSVSEYSYLKEYHIIVNLKYWYNALYTFHCWSTTALLPVCGNSPIRCQCTRTLNVHVSSLIHIQWFLLMHPTATCWLVLPNYGEVSWYIPTSHVIRPQRFCMKFLMLLLHWVFFRLGWWVFILITQCSDKCEWQCKYNQRVISWLQPEIYMYFICITPCCHLQWEGKHGRCFREFNLQY